MMDTETIESEPKYEAFFDSEPDDPIQIFGWYPIPTEKIKNPENIGEYIEQGLLREIEANDSDKATASEVRVDTIVRLSDREKKRDIKDLIDWNSGYDGHDNFVLEKDWDELADELIRYINGESLEEIQDLGIFRRNTRP